MNRNRLLTNVPVVETLDDREVHARVASSGSSNLGGKSFLFTSVSVDQEDASEVARVLAEPK